MGVAVLCSLQVSRKGYTAMTLLDSSILLTRSKYGANLALTWYLLIQPEEIYNGMEMADLTQPNPSSQNIIRLTKAVSVQV